MESLADEPQVRPEPSSPYDGLSGLELLAAMHHDGEVGLGQARPLQRDYAQRICERAGVTYPKGFLNGDVEQIWERRCRQVGYR